MQRLITELDFAGAVGESLADIRRQLLGGITLPCWPNSACRSSNSSSRVPEERKASRAFLSTLNESLSSVHYSFTESLDEGRALQNAAHLSGQALERELAAIDRAMAAHDSPQILRGAISGHLDTIRRLQQEREEMANRERHLLTHLSNMEAKLRLMKDETAEYKKRLSIQKHKLFLDSLTQVHNRAALDERLELEYKRWLRYGTPCAWPSSTSTTSSTSMTITATWPATRH